VFGEMLLAGRCGCDRMVVGFTTIYEVYHISAYHH
jgi:hypothetical protein